MTAPSNALPEESTLDAHERDAVREIEEWAAGETSTLSKVLRIAARPLDWIAERPEAQDLMEQVNERVAAFLGSLSDASQWTYAEAHVLERARDEQGLSADTIEDLRAAPLDRLDGLAQTYFGENTVLSVIEGGATGLGGAALIAADVPMLFTINLRMIQQIGAAYGFRLDGPEARPLVLRIFSAAVADTPEARQDALGELRTAGAALARGEAPTSDTDAGLDGEADADGTTTEENQSRVLVNEIARDLAAREMAQLIPLAGAATGAGMNYWFTQATAQAAYMLCRALALQHRQQRPA